MSEGVSQKDENDCEKCMDYGEEGGAGSSSGTVGGRFPEVLYLREAFQSQIHIESIL